MHVARLIAPVGSITRPLDPVEVLSSGPPGEDSSIVPSRLCTGTTVLTSGESICVWMAAITSFASIGRASSLGTTGASVTVGTGRASIAAPDRRLAKPVSTRASSAETVCRDSATTCCVIMLRRRIVTRAITLNTALTCGASWTPSLSIVKRIARVADLAVFFHQSLEGFERD